MQKSGKRSRRIKGLFARWNGNRKVHWEVKDRLFRFLFAQDREALLELYNALNGTDYQDASQLQVVTIENAVYVMMKNDLAFILAGTIWIKADSAAHTSVCGVLQRDTEGT